MNRDAVKKFRNFCFTLNNYVDTELVDTIPCRYIGYSKEVAKSGTPHLQGFICFTNATSLSSVIQKFEKKAHIEPMHGSIRQNEAYCSKEGVMVHRGDKPASNDDKGRANQIRYQQALEAAKKGDFSDIDADLYTRHYNTYKRIRVDYHPKPTPIEDVCGLWIFGASGIGKSRYVLAMYPDHYIKSRDQWWQSYQHQEVVCLDDLSIFEAPRLGSYMKDWADFKPFQAETKGSSMMIRPKLFIVTSQYMPEELWHDKNTTDAINRRFKVLKLDKNWRDHMITE